METVIMIYTHTLVNNRREGAVLKCEINKGKYKNLPACKNDTEREKAYSQKEICTLCW